MEKQPQGIQSVELAFELLESFLAIGSPVTLGEAAARLGVGKSKLHKYLTSFGRLKVVSQDESGRYTFGPKLLELGLGILGRMDIVTFCDPELHRLRVQSDEAAALALWTSQGPLIVRFLHNPKPVAIAMRVGFYAPVAVSAAGRCFAAYLPEQAYAHLLDAELGTDAGARERFRQELHETVSRGYALRTEPNSSIPGSQALACPVFDGSGEIVASVLLIGFEGREGDPSPQVIEALRHAAHNLSLRLGWTDEP